MSTMWVDKYKPKTTSELVGQMRNVARFKAWLKSYDSIRSKPLFIYGPPGIGKTTAAHLCCKELGYQTVEFNASDQRNKNIIKEVISTVASTSRLNFFGRASETKDAIILDEIDGMAGNEDRGGIAQLLIEIKHTKKPMIFICNDGQHQKLRTLKDKCETIEFKRPDCEAIKLVVTKIAKQENLKLDKINIENLAESSDYDIRQIINSLCLFKNGSHESLTKTTRINAFEATKKAFTFSKQLTMFDRFECFFSDYSIMPLFIYENYAKNRPVKGDHLRNISRAADALCLGDLVDKEIRTKQTWSLLNLQALLSTVIPTTLMSSQNVGRIDFPQFLGKLSNANKRLRLTQELNAHMCLSLRGGLDADYLDAMRERLSAPLIKKEAFGGIEAAVDFMYEYSLLREDFNSIMELATWSFKPDPMVKVDSKTKHSFTLAYKKRSVALPYFSEEKVTKRRIRYNDSDEERDEDEEEDEKEEVIKPKRVFKSKAEKPSSRSKNSDKSAKEKVKKEEKLDKEVKVKKEEKAKKGEKTEKDDSVKVEEKFSANVTKADKRPIDGGIARFFLPKKQKSS